MTDLLHWRRQPVVHHGRVQGHLVLRAMLEGLTAILLLVALVAGITGALLYGLVLVVTNVFG